MLKLQEIKSGELENTKPQTPQTVQFSTFPFSLKSLFVVGPSTEKSLKKALYIDKLSYTPLLLPPYVFLIITVIIKTNAAVLN